MCMTMRGVEKEGAKTTTSCMLGELRENSKSRQEFLSLVKQWIKKRLWDFLINLVIKVKFCQKAFLSNYAVLWFFRFIFAWNPEFHQVSIQICNIVIPLFFRKTVLRSKFLIWKLFENFLYFDSANKLITKSSAFLPLFSCGNWSLVVSKPKKSRSFGHPSFTL